MPADHLLPYLVRLAPRRAFVDRLRDVRRRWRTLLRLAVAPAVAYFIATQLVGHEQAFFAPIAAVIVLLGGVGLRQVLLIELIVGVAFGVLVGELLILGIGRGAWQLALILVITTTTAVFLGIKGLALTQAANSAVLLAAVLPVAGATNPAMTRFIDALIGGFCGLLMILVLPRNATRDIDREIRPLLEELGHVLDGVVAALKKNDPGRAEQALARARGLQGQVTTAQNTAANVTEVAAMSPMRWGQRAEVARYAAVLVDVDNAIRDARVLARRVSTTLRMGERCGEQMTASVEKLSHGVDTFAVALADPEAYARAQAELVESARLAVESLTDDITLNKAAVAAQVRSLAADLLFASGMTRDQLDVRLNFE